METSNSPLSNLNISEMSPEQIQESAKSERHKSQELQQKPGWHDPVHHWVSGLPQTQTRLVTQASPVPQTQMLQEQIQARQEQMRAVMQRSSAPQTHVNSGNLSELDQPSNQSPGIHKLAPNLYNPGQPGPLLHYSPRDRMRSLYRAPENNMTSDGQSTSLTPPFPMVQSAEREFKRPSTGSNIPKMTKETVFNRDLSASENVDILAEFDFDSFLNEGDDKSSFNLNFNDFKVAPSKPDQVSSEAALSQQREIKSQVEEPIPHNPNDSTQETNGKKRKANAVTDADNSSEPWQKPDITLEGGQSKRYS